ANLRRRMRAEVGVGPDSYRRTFRSGRATVGEGTRMEQAMLRILIFLVVKHAGRASGRRN
ncbi:hypothetical protein ABZ342_48615, partial [Amycolatopsis sp. NPDC005961]